MSEYVNFDDGHQILSALSKMTFFVNEFFGAKKFFYMNFDFKNGCKNKFKDKNEKSCS